jgi:serine/threonine protein kinase
MLVPGTYLGPYEIRSALGAGGMGEVYRGRDTRLGRDVAIKVQRPAVAQYTDSQARLPREAHLLSSLNHPRIASIYGLEDSGGVSALVLELVEGPTLADRIAQGPLPLDEAVPIAIQIAEALEAAHEKGIIHRDLKPANIKIRPDGSVKVLDFGLARALDAASEPSAASNLTQSPTLTSPPMMTGVGVILGTAAYMSPEQARGRPVDARGDVWSFGCVLFEMLSGRPAFDGESLADVLGAIVKSEPDWSRIRSETPAVVRALLRQCVQKPANKRLRDIADARIALEDVLAQPLRVDRLAREEHRCLSRQPVRREPAVIRALGGSRIQRFRLPLVTD